MATVRLNDKLANRLTLLANRTGRSKTYYVNEAISRCMEDIEDYYLAMQVLEEPGKVYSLNEMKKELGLEN